MQEARRLCAHVSSIAEMLRMKLTENMLIERTRGQRSRTQRTQKGFDAVACTCFMRTDDGTMHLRKHWNVQ